MQTILIQDDSKEKIKTLTDFAKKLGIKVKLLTNSDIEDIAIFNAIQQGRTKAYIDKDDFMKDLKK